MIVYHGGIQIIEHPIAAAGRARLDFGRGFYVTDIRSQAELWALRMQRIRVEDGVINVYEFNLEKAKKNFNYHHFEHYDNEWLQFIVANRMGQSDIMQYDLIEGGVADDRVIDTIEAYMANLMPLDVALRELARHQPNNQLCISNQQAIDECLKFVESYKL